MEFTWRRRVALRSNLYLRRSVPGQNAPKDGTEISLDAIRTMTDELFKTDVVSPIYNGLMIPLT
jgi:hypothetical protein